MAIFMVHPNIFYPKFVPPLFYIAHGTYLPLPEDCNICVGLWIRIHFFADPDPALILNADPDPPLKTCKKITFSLVAKNKHKSLLKSKK